MITSLRDTALQDGVEFEVRRDPTRPAMMFGYNGEFSVLRDYLRDQIGQYQYVETLEEDGATWHLRDERGSGRRDPPKRSSRCSRPSVSAWTPKRQGALHRAHAWRADQHRAARCGRRSRPSTPSALRRSWSSAWSMKTTRPRSTPSLEPSPRLSASCLRRPSKTSTCSTSG